VKKPFVVLTICSFFGFAFADRSITNLPQFEISDICAFGRLVIVDGKTDNKLSELISNTLEKYQALYDFKLIPKNVETCVIRGFFGMEANQISTGGYVLRYELTFSVGSIKAISVQWEGKEKPIDGLGQVDIWRTDGSGYVSNLSSLENQIPLAVQQTFEKFVLDWRKTHLK
jgi:hypothetical protein